MRRQQRTLRAYRTVQLWPTCRDEIWDGLLEELDVKTSCPLHKPLASPAWDARPIQMGILTQRSLTRTPKLFQRFSVFCRRSQENNSRSCLLVRLVTCIFQAAWPLCVSDGLNSIIKLSKKCWIFLDLIPRRSAMIIPNTTLQMFS